MNCNNNCSQNKNNRGNNCYDNIITLDIHDRAMRNQNYLDTVWTGCFMQMTVMCIPPCSDVGLSVMEDTDHIIRIEQGQCSVRMGCCPNELCFKQKLCAGDCVCVPAGTWHNIINIGNGPLKLSTIYAPPKHPREEVQARKNGDPGMDC